MQMRPQRPPTYADAYRKEWKITMSMSSLFSIAPSGLRAAQLRLDTSAHNVANMNTAGFRRHSVAQQAVIDQGGVRASVEQAPSEGAALEHDMVEQIAASYAFKANALVLRSADETLGTLLDTHV